MLYDGKDRFILMPSKVTIDDLFLVYITGHLDVFKQIPIK